MLPRWAGRSSRSLSLVSSSTRSGPARPAGAHAVATLFSHSRHSPPATANLLSCARSLACQRPPVPASASHAGKPRQDLFPPNIAVAASRPRPADSVACCVPRSRIPVSPICRHSLADNQARFAGAKAVKALLETCAAAHRPQDPPALAPRSQPRAHPHPPVPGYVSRTWNIGRHSQRQQANALSRE